MTHPHVDAAACWSVLDGVVQQDQEHLLQTLGVSFDPGRGCLGVQLEVHVLGLRQRGGPPHDVANQSRQLDGGGHQLQFATIGAGQRQEVLREPLDAGDFGANVVEQFTIALERLGPILIEQVGRRPQDGQRRA